MGLGNGSVGYAIGCRYNLDRYSRNKRIRGHPT